MHLSKNVVGLNTIEAFDPAMVALSQSMLHENPFICCEWLRQFERQLLKPYEQPLYIVVSCDGRPGLILPLIVETSRWLRLTRIRSMANFYTAIYSPIVDPEIRANPSSLQACIGAAMDYLKAQWKSCAMFELEPLRGDLEIYRQIEEAMNGGGYQTRRYDVTVNWYENFEQPPAFADYFKARPGRLRSTVKRRTKLLETETNCEIVVSSSTPQIARALADFDTVYQQSWKSPETYPGFIADIFPKMAAQGKVRVGVLYVNSQPSAAQIWLKIADGWGVFKLAYRPDDAKYSVGTLLTAHMIQLFLEMPETRSIDFLSGDDSYKRDWVTQRRIHWGIEAVNKRTLWGRLALIKRAVSRAVRSQTDSQALI